MSKRTKNKRQAKAQKQKMLTGLMQPLQTKSNMQNTLLETGKDLIIGVVGGGFTGAAIGKPSLIIGILSTGAGHFLGNRLLASFGMGMMASNGFQNKSSVKGIDEMEGFDGAKERIATYKDSFIEKTYLDKIKALANKNKKGTDGLGEVQYFTYPQNFLSGAEDDLRALNLIEQQVMNQGYQTAQVRGLDEVGSLEEIGSLDAVSFEEAIY